MPRLIDADALIKAVEKDFEGVCVYDVPPSEAVSDFERIIDSMPTIDAEPVRHGRWIDDMYFDEPVTRCTWCNRGFAKGHKAERFPYCHNCGAKMDLEGQDGKVD